MDQHYEYDYSQHELLKSVAYADCLAIISTTYQFTEIYQWTKLRMGFTVIDRMLDIGPKNVRKHEYL